MKKIKKQICLLSMMSLLISTVAFGQFDKKYENIKDDAVLKPSPVNFGIGVGLDYGGIGGKLTVFPEEHVGVFGSVGYTSLGVGYNAGLSFRMFPKSFFLCPTAAVMYGNNSYIRVDDLPQYNKNYFGPSVSGGVEIRSRKRRNNFLNIQIIISLAPGQYNADLDYLKNTVGINFNPSRGGLLGTTHPPNAGSTNALHPFSFSLGYHFGLKRG